MDESPTRVAAAETPMRPSPPPPPDLAEPSAATPPPTCETDDAGAEAAAEDAAALRRLVEGDPAAFDALVDRHKHRLVRHILRRVRDPHVAEDLAQESFLRLFRAARAGGYSGRARVVTWLFTIAKNCVTDHLRAIGRRGGRPDAPDALSNREPDPRAAAERREGDHRVESLLSLLPDAQRQVVELKVLDGLSFGDIAELLGCPVPTVKSRLVYALRKLRQSLTDEQGRTQS